MILVINIWMKIKSLQIYPHLDDFGRHYLDESIPPLIHPQLDDFGCQSSLDEIR